MLFVFNLLFLLQFINNSWFRTLSNILDTIINIIIRYGFLISWYIRIIYVLRCVENPNTPHKYTKKILLESLDVMKYLESQSWSTISCPLLSCPKTVTSAYRTKAKMIRVSVIILHSTSIKDGSSVKSSRPSIVGYFNTMREFSLKMIPVEALWWTQWRG